MSFEVHVQDIDSAAGNLAAGKSPTLAAQGAPNVGETDIAAQFKDSYGVWLATRREDLAAAQQQVDSLVKAIRDAAKAYDDDDSAARDAFMKSLDDDLDQLDR